MKLGRRTFGLAFACAVLTGALCWRLFGPTPALEIADRSRPTTEFTKLFEAPAPVELSALSSRPLFHKTRQFVQPPDPSAPDLRPPPPTYLFAGALLVPDRPAVAYLKHTQSGASVKLKVGEVLEGWTVNAIDGRSVSLSFETESIRIGGAERGAGGIVAIAPRAASSVGSGGIRTLTAPGANSVQQPTQAPTLAPESKPRTYQPPPSS